MADIKISELGAASAVNATDLFPMTSSGVTVKATAQQIKNYMGVGNLSDLDTTDKSSAVAAINEVDGHADNAQTTANNAQQMIAPIQSNLTASKAYAVGEQFVYNGLLYKATATIAQGGTIAIGGNCTLADSVTRQIKTFKDKFHYSLVARTLGSFGETSLVDSQGNTLLYNNVIVLNVSTPNSNIVCTPYYSGGIWAAQLKELTGTYATGEATIQVLYVDRYFYA